MWHRLQIMSQHVIWQVQTGLCKTWTMDWTGLWTRLWTDQNSCIQTANTTKATKACPQLCLKLLSCCWVLEASSSQFLRGQRSRAYLISFHKGSSGRLLVGSIKVRPSRTCIYCFLWRPHASVGKASSPIFDWALVRTLCSLEGIEEQLFWTETTLQPLLKCRKQKEDSSVIHDHSWSSFLLIKYACDHWPRRNRGTDASTG